MSLPALDPDLPYIEDLRALFVSDTPLIDVRAPIEFKEGAFPHAQSLPLMNDEERKRIGTCYKHSGQDAAIELGLKLVSGTTKTQRVAAWSEFAQQHPHGVLYCFRGGLRSRISQHWLYEHSGIRYPRVKGGYKAMRRYLLDLLETPPTELQPVILSGRTGSGKTRFLHTVKHMIDLEGLANHRGSAFGTQPTPQPTQISFENSLAIALLRKIEQGQYKLLFEDESRTVGSRHLPKHFFERLQDAPVILLEVPKEERVEISYQEYVIDTCTAFVELHHGNTETGFAAFQDYLLSSLQKIKRRLGGDRYQQVVQMMQSALQIQAKTGSTSAHYDWVRFILLDYYDPMYNYQLSKKQQRVVFQGTVTEVRAYLSEQGIT